MQVEWDEGTEKHDSNINIPRIELFSNYKSNARALYNIPSLPNLIPVVLRVKCKKNKKQKPSEALQWNLSDCQYKLGEDKAFLSMAPNAKIILMHLSVYN